jgi:hypothetical protein
VNFETIKKQIKIKVIENEEIRKISRTFSEGITECFIMKLGFILFPTQEYIYPYNIYTYNENRFDFRIAIYQHSRIDENNLRNGMVLYGRGEYYINNIFTIKICDKKLMKWQTDLSIDELIKKCNRIKTNANIENERFKIAKQGGQFRENNHLLYKTLEIGNYGTIKYGGIVQPIIKDSAGYCCVRPEKNCKPLRIHWLVADAFLPIAEEEIYCDVHHINGCGEDNRQNNLLRVSMEQHASIEQFMWNNYEINKNGFLMYKK